MARVRESERERERERNEAARVLHIRSITEGGRDQVSQYTHMQTHILYIIYCVYYICVYIYIFIYLIILYLYREFIYTMYNSTLGQGDIWVN